MPKKQLSVMVNTQCDACGATAVYDDLKPEAPVWMHVTVTVERPKFSYQDVWLCAGCAQKFIRLPASMVTVR